MNPRKLFKHVDTVSAVSTAYSLFSDKEFFIHLNSQLVIFFHVVWFSWLIDYFMLFTSSAFDGYSAGVGLVLCIVIGADDFKDLLKRFSF